MEARLFFVAIWCGAYGLILRTVHRKNLEKEKLVPILMNGLFWGTASFLLGMLVSSYRNEIQFTLFDGIKWIGVGFVIGGIMGYWRGRSDDQRSHLLRDNLEWADTGFSAILLASFVMFFIVQAFKIPSGSMRMTFVEGDHLFANKFVYGIRVPFTKVKLFPFREVRKRDIIIFQFPAKGANDPHRGKDFIKRVVAVAGQTVELKDKRLFVDGIEQLETYGYRLIRQNDLDFETFKKEVTTGRTIDSIVFAALGRKAESLDIKSVVKVLRSIQKTPDLFAQGEIEKLSLHPEIRDLLNRSGGSNNKQSELTKAQRRKLNRALLEAFYPGGIIPAPPYVQHIEPMIYENYYGSDSDEFQQQWVNRRISNAGREIRDNFGPVRVPPHHIFVMGDNRDRSFDSRFWGPLDLDQIKGKALLKYWGPVDPTLLEDKPWMRFWPLARIHCVD